MSDKTHVPPAKYAVLFEIVAEVERATRKFPQWPTDPIHAAAVIAEECGELQKAVLEAVYEPHKGSRPNIRAEAVQTAAMCLRFLASLDEYEWTQAKQHEQNASGQPRLADTTNENDAELLGALFKASAELRFHIKSLNITRIEQNPSWFRHTKAMRAVEPYVAAQAEDARIGEAGATDRADGKAGATDRADRADGEVR